MPSSPRYRQLPRFRSDIGRSSLLPWARAVKWRLLPLAVGVRARLPLGRVRDRPTFIVGSPRSGTTILGLLTGLQPHVTYLNEPFHYWYAIDHRTDHLAFLGSGGSCWLDGSEATPGAAARMDRLFGQAQSGAVLVEKTPINALRMEWIAALAPGCRFIHIVRDAREVASSVTTLIDQARYSVAGKADLHIWWGRSHYKWRRLVQEGRERGFHARALADMGGEQARDDRAMGLYQWLVSVRQARLSAQTLGLGGDRYLELRYDRLLDDPVAELAGLEEFVGAPHEPGYLERVERELRPRREREFSLALPGRLFADVCELQEELGYATAGIRRGEGAAA